VLDGAFFNSWQWKEISLFSRMPIPLLRPTQCPNQWMPKQLQCKADHLPPSSAKVKNEWSYTFTPLYAFMAHSWTLLLSYLQVYDFT
jgi:hypothetical protein